MGKLCAVSCEKTRRTTRLKENAIQGRVAEIDKSIQLQQNIISRIAATGMFQRINP